MSDVLELLARANPIPEGKQPEMEARASALADSWRMRVAAATEAAPRRRWRPAVVAISSALVLVVVGTALALRGHWLDHSKAESAPPRVFTEFAKLDRGAPPGVASGLVASESRRVLVVDNDLAKRTFWIAPNTRGRYCVVLHAGGVCEKLGPWPLSSVWGVNGRRPADRRVMTVIYGDVNAKWVDSLLLRFADGDTARPPVTWVNTPVGGYGFFYYDVPAEHRVGGHEATQLEALDARGNVVSASYNGSAVEPVPPVDAIQDEKTALARVQTSDGEAILWRAPTRYGTSCAWIQLGERAHTLGCLRPGYHNPYYTWLLTRRSVVVAGEVGPRFDRVELQFADFSHVSVKLVHGYLLYSIPPDHLVAAKQLVAFRVDNPDGSAAFEDELTLGLSGCNAPLPTAQTCR
jgi:hypothetical protein